MATNNAELELFAEVGQASGETFLPKLTPGTYTVRIDRTTLRQSENPKTKHLKFGIVEVTVMNAEEGAGNAVNSPATISLNTSWPSFGKTVTNLIASAAKADPKKVTPQKAVEFFGADAQKNVSGTMLKVRVVPGVSKSTGREFLAYQFSSVA